MGPRGSGRTLCSFTLHYLLLIFIPHWLHLVHKCRLLLQMSIDTLLCVMYSACRRKLCSRRWGLKALTQLCLSKLISGSSNGESLGPWPHLRSFPQVNFLLPIIGHLGLKFNDYLLMSFKKLHIWTYDWQNFPVTDPLLETPGCHWPLQSGGGRTTPWSW